MTATLAQVLRQHGGAYLAQRNLSTPQAKAWRGIVACRTAALGGELLACPCGHSHWQYHSCRNRHCPLCGARTKDAWLQGRLAEVLPVPYAHLVFTLPHCLNSLYGAHPRWLIDTLFASAAQTLNAFAANPRWMDAEGGTPAFSLVLHTWTQDLRVHLHVHAVMACGVLKDDEWHAPARKPNYLFPVQALSKVFRAKFIAALQHARHALPRDPCSEDSAYKARLRQLYQHDWVVYAKTPMGGPAQVLDYLSRYTHRTAIGNERIKAIPLEEVVFTVRADNKGGKRRVRMPGIEFIHRFMQHVLPTGIKRIRHYGVLSSASKSKKLGAAKAALHMPASNPIAKESAQDFMRRVAKINTQTCPCCKQSSLRVVQTLKGQKHLPLPGQHCHNRGPPP